MKTALLLASLFAANEFWISDAFGQGDVRRITTSGSSFVFLGSEEAFTPWGFNYDRDWDYRLIEDYWNDEWDKVEEDFRELQALGARVVRIYLQYHRFMDGPTSRNEENLSRLRDLVIFAESLGIYLDITGLGSFRPKDDPSWYVDLGERERWAAQAAFWEAISETLENRPGVFAFNLMNEPLVSGEQLEPGAWVHPDEIEGLHYLQYINLDADGREREDIGVAWIREMTRAIRLHDRQRLITVGLFPLFGLVDGAGFDPRHIATEIDFISVHIYPQAGQVNQALELLERYDVGLPILIEETFPLSAGIEEYRRFLRGSRPIADGWISFYWGETKESLRERNEPRANHVADAISVFEELRP